MNVNDDEDFNTYSVCGLRNKVEPELIHASPLSEASKKRLIEDTEDWHPRTGTSQSRSFRILAQITGTEKGGYPLCTLPQYPEA